MPSDNTLSPASNNVSNLASQVGALPGGQQVLKAAHKGTDMLSSAADYIRDHDVRDMMSDVQRLLKDNPGPALLGAAVLGFLVARSFDD